MNGDNKTNPVFISYSSKNRDAADAVRALLQKKGISCWMAPHDIPVGQKYAGVISKAVRECGCFLLLLTNDSQNSVWVAKEVERAVNYNKSIITMQLEDVTLNDEFELYISSEQMIAVPKIDEDHENMQKVLRAIFALLGADGGMTDGGEEFDFGDVLKDTYSLAAKIGEGGFGAVYNAFNMATEERVAVKVSRLPAKEQQYVSEETLARLAETDSPYLCKVFESFIHAGRLCVVEEHLYRHTNIGDYVAITKKADTEVMGLVVQMLMGLSVLHKNGIFHGDISPSNVMVSIDGEVKITDYSSSFIKGGPRTGDHTRILTYMAPDMEYTERSEVYSVGATAVALLTGSFCKSVGDGKVVFMKAVDEKLKEILLKATAEDPTERFESADAFAEALEAYIASRA